MSFHNDEVDRRFRLDGFVVAPLLDASALAALQSGFLRHHENQQSLGFEATLLHRDFETRERVNQLVSDIVFPRVQDLIEGFAPLVGNFVTKWPGQADSSVPVHQDWSFVDERHFQSLNVWCPLEDTTVDNGPLCVFRGSHHLQNFIRGPAVPEPRGGLLAQRDRGEPVTLLLRAGEAVIYPHRLIHCSPTNRTQMPRTAASLSVVQAGAELYHARATREANELSVEVYQVTREFFLRTNLNRVTLGGVGASEVKSQPIPNQGD